MRRALILALTMPACAAPAAIPDEGELTTISGTLLLFADLGNDPWGPAALVWEIEAGSDSSAIYTYQFLPGSDSPATVFSLDLPAELIAGDSLTDPQALHSVRFDGVDAPDGSYTFGPANLLPSAVTFTLPEGFSSVSFESNREPFQASIYLEDEPGGNSVFDVGQIVGGAETNFAKGPGLILIPEAGTLGLALLGLVVLVLRRRRAAALIPFLLACALLSGCAYRGHHYPAGVKPVEILDPRPMDDPTPRHGPPPGYLKRKDLIAARAGGVPGSIDLAPAITAETLQCLPPNGPGWAIFSHYSSTQKTYNPHWDIDFSGVVWNHSRAGTLIGRRHMVCAHHYYGSNYGNPEAWFAYAVGHVVTFYDRNGQAHSRTIVARARAGKTDIGCYLLDADLPSSVRHYRTLALQRVHSYDGAQAIRTKYNQRSPDVPARSASVIGLEAAGAWYIEGIRVTDPYGLAGMVDYKPGTNPTWEGPPLTTGDSGHPVFILFRGEPVLVATHSSSTIGTCYLSAYVGSDIRKAFDSMQEPVSDSK
jgi:hypothetical protein